MAHNIRWTKAPLGKVLVMESFIGRLLTLPPDCAVIEGTVHVKYCPLGLVEVSQGSSVGNVSTIFFENSALGAQQLDFRVIIKNIVVSGESPALQ